MTPIMPHAGCPKAKLPLLLDTAQDSLIDLATFGQMTSRFCLLRGLVGLPRFERGPLEPHSSALPSAPQPDRKQYSNTTQADPQPDQTSARDLALDPDPPWMRLSAGPSPPP